MTQTSVVITPMITFNYNLLGNESSIVALEKSVELPISSQYQHKEQTRDANVKGEQLKDGLRKNISHDTSYSTQTIPRASAINLTKYTL